MELASIPLGAKGKASVNVHALATEHISSRTALWLSSSVDQITLFDDDTRARQWHMQEASSARHLQ